MGRKTETLEQQRSAWTCEQKEPKIEREYDSSGGKSRRRGGQDALYEALIDPRGQSDPVCHLRCSMFSWHAMPNNAPAKVNPEEWRIRTADMVWPIQKGIWQQHDQCQRCRVGTAATTLAQRGSSDWSGLSALGKGRFEVSCGVGGCLIDSGLRSCGECSAGMSSSRWSGTLVVTEARTVSDRRRHWTLGSLTPEFVRIVLCRWSFLACGYPSQDAIKHFPDFNSIVLTRYG